MRFFVYFCEVKQQITWYVPAAKNGWLQKTISSWLSMVVLRPHIGNGQHIFWSVHSLFAHDFIVEY